MGFVDVSLLCSLVLLGGVYVIQVKDLQWEILSVERIGHSHIEILSPLYLGIIRGLFALVVWVVTALHLFSNPNGIQLTIIGSNKTKKVVILRGLEKLTMFTVWSWILQGVYFTLTCYCSLQASMHDSKVASKSFSMITLPELPLFLQRISWVLFEISFPVAFLISLVVKYLLIPGCKKDKLPTVLFFQPIALLMHNANIVFMCFEFWINQLPFVFTHIVFMLFYGLAYVSFSWFWFWSRGYYYYFFLDYDRQGAIWWYIALIIFLCLLFLAGYECSHLQDHYSHLVPNLITLLLTCLSSKLVDDKKG